MEKDYYQILGVPPSADARQIRAAFRRMAKVYHPDAQPAHGPPLPEDTSAHQRFAELNEAYRILMDPVLRSRYDLRRTWAIRSMFEQPAAEPGPQPRTAPYTRYDPPPQPPPQETEAVRTRKQEFARFQPVSRMICFFSLLFGLTVVADYFLSQPSQLLLVRRKEVLTQGALGLLHYLEAPPYRVRIDAEYEGRVGTGDWIQLEITPVFGIITRLTPFRERAQQRNAPANRKAGMDPQPAFAPHYGIYSTFLAFLALQLMVSAAGLALIRQPEWVFKLALLTALLTCINIYLVAIS